MTVTKREQKLAFDLSHTVSKLNPEYSFQEIVVALMLVRDALMRAVDKERASGVGR